MLKLRTYSILFALFGWGYLLYINWRVALAVHFILWSNNIHEISRRSKCN